jgi:hypothetical protein
MFASIFASHQPQITTAPVAPPTPPAPPAPTPSPQPPVAQPIAFSAVTRGSLFGVTGSAIGSTTLATITCADAAMTISVSEVVPGLTFSYAANVLTVAGTPTTPTGVHRVVVSYIASDGTNSVRGTTAHEITIVSASEVLTIGPMAGASLKVGRYFTAVLATPTTNYAVDVTASPQGRVPGCAVSLIWSKGVGSGSGSLVFSGTPTEAGTYALAVNFYANGILLGTSTHAVVVAEAYSAASPAPAPSPAPSPPAPSAPPAPAPITAFGRGPDPFLSSVKVLMGFDVTITGIGYDPSIGPPGVGDNVVGAPATMRAITTTGDGGALSYGVLRLNGRGGGQIYTDAAVLQPGSGLTIPVAATASSTTVAGVDGSSGSLAVECFVKVEASTWAALAAPGDDGRLFPVVSLVDSAGALVWVLGYASWLTVETGLNRRVVAPVSIAALKTERAGIASNKPLLMAVGSELSAPPSRWTHLATARKASGSTTLLAVWNDGQTGKTTAKDAAANLKPCTSGRIHIGAGCPVVSTDYGVLTPMLGRAAIDELRVTAAERYWEFIAEPPLHFTGWATGQPSWANQSIPWPNY